MEKKRTWAVEGFLLFCEGVLVMLTFFFHNILFVWISIDVLIMSPIKAGNAFFYDQLLTDSTDGRFRYLFRYFRSGWFRTILWRVGLWSRYIFWWLLFSVPAIAIDLIRVSFIVTTENFQNQVLNITALLASYILWISGTVVAWIFCARYQSAVYFLPNIKNTRQLFTESKKGYQGELLYNKLRLLSYLPLFVFIFPYFRVLPRYRMEQAKIARQKIKNSPKQSISLLARLKKIC